MAEIRNRKGSGNKNSSKTNNSEELKETKGNVSSLPFTFKNIPLRIVARVVVITSLLIVVYYNTQTDKIQPFAKQSELLVDGKIRIVECSAEYMAEVDKFEGCVPKRCKRVVNDKVITEAEAAVLLEIAKKGLRLGGSNGGASILDLHSGALSYGNHFINIYKNKEAKKLFTNRHFDIYRETYKSFHFTTLLYLNDFGVNFKGGRFVFIDNWVNRTVEPRKARLSMFTSGKENYHYVEKVTDGVRYAMTISFTCNKKYAINEPDLNNFFY